ncbi:class I SAM-dependent methyltransferase [Polaribacter porphyrae]|uniref:Methyltransferase type 11 domain-containing protein n=1 Tax=Polaribacter porphyrae TaxID=1137780 RepID=A0A2S7WP23_9FLAO|nr:methyltransferase domain-containing protein [Polaribacter porphyrae]PQJ79349.1 hypothetical protein BTO18_09255 [Polaribacter porphyrae]
MKILHPNNDMHSTLEELKSYYSDGFYSIIADNEKEKLNIFLNAFANQRKVNNDFINDKSLYKNLPFSMNTITWKERQKDAKIIAKLIENRTHLEILDVGCWNGWLCNYLSQKGHNLTGINFFKDEIDGLKCYENYDTKSILLQMHVDELFRIEKKFDIIVFNRNWAFFENKTKTLSIAKKILNPNGRIIITGLAFYRNTSNIKDYFNYKKKEFKKKYNISLFYKKSKGYLDFNDKKVLKENNISIYSYNALKNFLKILFPKKPIIYYGLFTNKVEK